MNKVWVFGLVMEMLAFNLNTLEAEGGRYLGEGKLDFSK